MQIILSLILTGIGLTYCMETIFGLHKQTLLKMRRENWKKYILFQTRTFFGMGLLVLAGEIAYLAHSLSASQNFWMAAGSCIVGTALIVFNKYRFSVLPGCKSKQQDISKVFIDK